jgi:hypothetical protein
MRTTSTRKLGVAPEVARRKVELLARLDVVTIDVAGRNDGADALV